MHPRQNLAMQNPNTEIHAYVFTSENRTYKHGDLSKKPNAELRSACNDIEIQYICLYLKKYAELKSK